MSKALYGITLKGFPMWLDLSFISLLLRTTETLCTFEGKSINTLTLDVVEMGKIKVFGQKVGIKQGFLADTNMDYLTSEWPGTPNFKVDANFDVFPQKYG